MNTIGYIGSARYLHVSMSFGLILTAYRRSALKHADVDFHACCTATGLYSIGGYTVFV